MISLMPVTPISCRRVSSFMSPRRCKSTSYISSIVRINVSPRFWRSSPVRSRARCPVIPGSSCRTGGALRLDIAKLLRRSVASFHYICLSHRSRSTPPLPFSQSREATRSILALRERTRCRIPSCLCGWPGGDSPRTLWSQSSIPHTQDGIHLGQARRSRSLVLWWPPGSKGARQRDARAAEQSSNSQPDSRCCPTMRKTMGESQGTQDWECLLYHAMVRLWARALVCRKRSLAMFNYLEEAFSPKEKVAILFKEYDTLRTEIIGRTAGGYQLIAILAIVFGAILGWRSSHGSDAVFWVALGVFFGAALVFWWWARRDINMIARRIRDIELNINRLCGDTLLIWETSMGGMAGGWLLRRSKSN